MKRKMIVVAMLATTGLLLCGVNSVFAIDQQCNACHTMHNSQNGSAVDGDGPNRVLLNDSCTGCHTGDNDTWAADGTVPYVYDTAATYGTDTLAGGNFLWVKTINDEKGHNVFTDGFDTEDSNLGQNPPGYNAATNVTNMPEDWLTVDYQLTCSGTTGCHGKRESSDELEDISGAHHGNVTGALTGASTVYNSFRFLKGIKGYEDTDWEMTTVVGVGTVNQYYGVHRGSIATGAESDQATISAYCAQCHGTFHSGVIANDAGDTSAEPWLRHPTDYSVEAAQDTGNDYIAVTTYNVAVPVGFTNLNGDFTITDTDTTDNIVTCISCHRAHGSPYDDLMRFNYNSALFEAEAGGNDHGCFWCHTTKN